MPTSIAPSGVHKYTQHIYGLTCRSRFPSRYMTPAGTLIEDGYQLEARS